MPVIIRATVAIRPGTRLYYDCPLKGADYRSEQFFEKHHGKYATFIGYAERLVDVLDPKGLMPGRYLDPENIRVQFDGEEPAKLNVQHFVLKHEDDGRLVNASEEERLGDLPHPILFYPGDMVRFKEKPDADGITDEPRRVRHVFLGKPFTRDDIPRYEVMETEAETAERIRKFHEENDKRPEEDRLWSSPLDSAQGWNTVGENIELVSRGNVWALYNDPTKLLFETDEAEAAFWARDGICRYVGDEVKMSALGLSRWSLNSTFGLSFEDAHRLFTAGHTDVITPTFSNPGDGPRYKAKVVYECFAEHRGRIRALTDQLWAHQVKQPAA